MNPFAKKEEPKKEEVKPFVSKNPFANFKKPPQRIERDYGPFAIPVGKNMLGRYERRGEFFYDKMTGRQFNEEQILAKLNQINDHLFSLHLEYHSVLGELAVARPDFKDPAGSLVLRYTKFRNEYNEITE